MPSPSTATYYTTTLHLIFDACTNAIVLQCDSHYYLPFIRCTCLVLCAVPCIYLHHTVQKCTLYTVQPFIFYSMPRPMALNCAAQFHQIQVIALPQQQHRTEHTELHLQDICLANPKLEPMLKSTHLKGLTTDSASPSVSNLSLYIQKAPDSF